MSAALTRYLRRRKMARIEAKLQRVRQQRLVNTAREFALRGQLAIAEASL